SSDLAAISSREPQAIVATARTIASVRPRGIPALCYDSRRCRVQLAHEIRRCRSGCFARAATFSSRADREPRAHASRAGTAETALGRAAVQDDPAGADAA